MTGLRRVATTLVAVLGASSIALSAAPGSAAGRSSTTVYVRGMSGGFKVDPRRLNAFTAAGLTRLHWRHWGHDRTYAHGRFTYFNRGHRKHARAKVQLSKVHRCEGVHVYSRLRWRASGVNGGRWQSFHYNRSTCSL